MDGARGEVTGLQTLEQMVLDHLWSDLEEETREYAQQPAPSWQDQERWELEAFVENRGRGFLGRQEITRELLALALSPPEEGATWGACVTGPAGAGKSSLFAHLYRLLQADDVLLLAHAAGTGVRSGQVDTMLCRWIGELASFLGEPDPVGEESTAEELEETFASLLGRASTRRRVVVLLDALNQFEPTVRGRHLTWLPKLWPANARLLATAIPGTATQALQARGGSHRNGIAAADGNGGREYRPRRLPTLPPHDPPRGLVGAGCQRAS